MGFWRALEGFSKTHSHGSVDMWEAIGLRVGRWGSGLREGAGLGVKMETELGSQLNEKGAWWGMEAWTEAPGRPWSRELGEPQSWDTEGSRESICVRVRGQSLQVGVELSAVPPLGNY